ncbi:MAG: hypothetical protein ACI8WB_000096 [Phenylobacterium sp.]|jgi:hypothetical protein
MWSKTFAAIVAGALLSASLAININVLLPVATDSKLLVSVLLAFVLWVAVMVACYGCKNGWQAWRRCGGGLLLSAGLNTLMLWPGVVFSYG